MSRKRKTIYDIMAKVNVKTPPRIKGELNYEGIYKMMHLLYANAETLSTPQGGGHHRNIRITINLMLCTTLLTTARENPSKLGVYPMEPSNATAYHQDHLQIQHDKGRIIY